MAYRIFTTSSTSPNLLVLPILLEFTLHEKMTDTRKFKATDLFSFNNINLDPLTETVSYHLPYLKRTFINSNNF